MYFTCVCLCVCELECLCIWFCYVTVCESIFVCSVFRLWNFVWEALCRLDSCTHHFQPSNCVIMSLDGKKNKLNNNNKKMKMRFQNTLDNLWTEKQQLSNFSSWNTQALCIYSIYTLSLRLQFAYREIVATFVTLAPTVSWLRQVIT